MLPRPGSESKPNQQSTVADYGADLGKYKWWQTEDEVTVTIPLPAGTKGKDVQCKMEIGHVLFCLKGQTPIVDSQIFAPIKLDDSTWTFESGSHEAQLIMSKREKGVWWKSAFVGDEEIDVDLIEGSKYLDDSLLRQVKEAKQKQKLEEAAKQQQAAAQHEEPKVENAES